MDTAISPRESEASVVRSLRDWDNDMPACVARSDYFVGIITSAVFVFWMVKASGDCC